MTKMIDLVGQKFGRLFVIEEAGRTSGKTVLWKCRCDCGNEIVVRGTCLRNGHTTSCGCKKVEATIKRNYKHGESKSGRLYSIWQGIRSRTINNSSEDDYHRKYYQDKGITLCDEWLEFPNFKKWSLENGYRDNLTIDRIDVNGNYCPNNCRWASIKEQANNKTNNVFLTYKGETKTMMQWSEITGINYQTLMDRYYHGKQGDSLFESTNHDRPVVRISSNKSETLYPSIMTASKETGIARGEIAVVCNHPERRHTAGGYGWRYASKEEVA